VVVVVVQLNMEEEVVLEDFVVKLNPLLLEQ
jgi:hypothetical protein